MTITILVAGANGNLGILVCKHLLKRSTNAKVIAVVRKSNKPPNQELEALAKGSNGRLIVVAVDYSSTAEIDKVVAGAYTIVSTLQGLEDVLHTVQLSLLQSAINYKVKRFIPSDYAADFTLLPVGQNRNFDIRRGFHTKAQALISSSKSPIQFTSVYQGGFTELLIKDVPLINYKTDTIEYMGSPDTPMEYTTWDNTAEYTAAAALDGTETPSKLVIAGSKFTAKELVVIAGQTMGRPFAMKQAVSLWFLENVVLTGAKWFAPGKPGDTLPLWQGIQYGISMACGLAVHDKFDNDRYPGIEWVGVDKIIEQGYAHYAETQKKQ